MACNGQGTCSSGDSGICSCDSGFTGERCNITTCPGSSGKVCSGNGNCPVTMVCDCQAGFYGDDCASKLEKRFQIFFINSSYLQIIKNSIKVVSMILHLIVLFLQFN